MSQQSQDSGNDGLLIGAFTGQMQFVVPFLREGGAVSYTNSYGDTMLHAAAQGWQHRMVEFLCIWGADVNAQNSVGDTPLHAITHEGDVPSNGDFIQDIEPLEARKATFRVLAMKRADMSLKNVQGATPLHLAASSGDSLALLQLIANGSDRVIDELTDGGAPALVYAILGEHVECVRLLLNAGADAYLRLKDGARPIDMMTSIDNEELRSLASDL